MFSFEIEYLNCVSYSSRVDDRSRSEWPPHPDRVFLALVAAWGNSNKEPLEAEALRWLESQNPPDIIFPDPQYRTPFINYVPISSNVVNAQKYLDNDAVYEIEKNIVRKDREFPATILPNNNRVYIVWRDAEISPEFQNALLNLANRIPYIGHSASLVRVTVTTKTDYKYENRYVCNNYSGYFFLRCPHKGRFDSLIKEHDHHASLKENIFQWRPSIAPTNKYQEFVPAEIPNNMGKDWIIISCHGNFIPPLESFPIVAKKMRDAIMSHIPNPVHGIISGHNLDGTILQKPHLAIIPMANIGWKKYSDGRLLGIAMILPNSSKYGTEERTQLKRAVAQFLNTDHAKSHNKTSNHNTGIGTLQIGEYTQLKLKKHDDNRRSLDPERYISKSRAWSTITPIVLDKHPKKNKSAEEIIAQSCVNIGLPKPESIKISRYSHIVGVPPAFIAKKSNKGWKPHKLGILDNKFICHASLMFKDKIHGPLIIGSGRYYGLGLCMAYRDEVP